MDSIYNPNYVKDLFDKMSRSYEQMNFISSFGFSIRWRTQFLKPIEKSDQQLEIIDRQTGMGETWSITKNKFPNSKLTALDFSDGMLMYARGKSKNKFNNQVVVLQQDILINNLPSNHFDIVTCAFGLKTFSAEQLLVIAKETKRILKKGGQFTFVEISKPNNKILKTLYAFYLGQIIPILGRLFLGNPEEYKMLWRYTSQYENAKIAANTFSSIGLNTTYSSYFYGCASGFYGTKTVD